MRLDMSQAGAYTPLAEARHRVKVIKADIHPSKKSGIPTLRLDFQPISRLDGKPIVRVDGKDGTKAVLFREQAMGGESLWALANVLIALGYKKEEVIRTDFDLQPNDLVGREANATVIVDSSYDGTPRNRIDSLYPVDVEVGARR